QPEEGPRTPTLHVGAAAVVLDLEGALVLLHQVIDHMESERHWRGWAPAGALLERGAYVEHAEHRSADHAGDGRPEVARGMVAGDARLGQAVIEALVGRRVVVDESPGVLLCGDPCEQGVVRLVVLGDELADEERLVIGRGG